MACISLIVRCVCLWGAFRMA